jgi:hypothetical protein
MPTVESLAPWENKQIWALPYLISSIFILNRYLMLLLSKILINSDYEYIYICIYIIKYIPIIINNSQWNG